MQSPPSRRCGLKQNVRPRVILLVVSPPSRRCGLKQDYKLLKFSTIRVTSLAEVWIETRPTLLGQPYESVTSLAEVWIETAEVMPVYAVLLSHLPRGGVD